MYDLNTWLSDRNIHKIFFMKTLMHTNTSSKTTHSIKTSLTKQCYICYAWTGANNAADTVMLLILLCCWYWYAADTVMLLILLCCWYWYAADTVMLLILLILICCWYCYAADTDMLLVCMLYTTCSMFRAWPVYFLLLCHAEIMQLLNHILSKLNKSSILPNTLKSFKT
jgi:hypothetical protein